MSSSGMLHLDRLSLRNFRCFTACEVELHGKLTVLVADNGHGKTAILDAIGIALGLFVDTVSGIQKYRGFDREDVRHVPAEDGAMRAALPTEIEASGSVDGKRIRWSRALAGDGARARTTTKDAGELRRAAQGLRDRIDAFAAGPGKARPLLPLVAFYGTGRLWSEHRLTEGKRGPDPATLGRLSGYIDCLSSSSSFKTFVAWYEDMANAARNPASVAYGPQERPEKLLAAVRKATRAVLAPTGWHSLDWDFEQRKLVVEHADHGRLPLSALSDGVRNMVALVADLAHRCVRLNPHFGEEAARSTPGILLIDEVDMHLHPRWQQLVVDLLRKVFPEMQMVVTTHSPHVLSTVDVDSIRIIRHRDGETVLDTPTFQTRGVESADVLAAIMGVDPVPQVEEARLLTDYRALVQTGRDDRVDGRRTWQRLIEHFGADHPVIHDLATLRRLQEFKRMHNLPRSEGG
ncbi:AAA family ATPase [Sorangium sp. So ce381]|uniref:AAA family ATPase n=1 Tax=Sorangium sp. So ce381 TaxID=3133307 RepID=UPI003F5CA776